MTALTQYIEWKNSNNFRVAEDRGDWDLIELKEKEFLELEREQILE